MIAAARMLLAELLLRALIWVIPRDARGLPLIEALLRYYRVA